jgi:hypothetical protein
MTIDIAELERLLAEATPGQWRLELYMTNPPRPSGILASTKPVAVVGSVETWRLEDARLVVSAVRALPELIQRVREWEQSSRSDEPHEAAGVGVDQYGPFQACADGRHDADAEYVIRTLVAHALELEARVRGLEIRSEHAVALAAAREIKRALSEPQGPGK